MDQITRMYTPARFIRTIDATYNIATIDIDLAKNMFQVTPSTSAATPC